MRRAALAILPLVLTGCGAGEVRTASFELAPFEDGGPLGVAHLEQDGKAVRGWVAVWGLRPGSSHAAHLGPTGASCRRLPSDPRLRLPALHADEDGVAFGRFAARGEAPVADARWALTVHTGDARSARAACGAAAPGQRLSEAALTAAGPSGARVAPVAGLVQLRGGRPVGRVRTLRGRVGERLAVAVRSDRRDELSLDGLGLAFQVGPGQVARFTLRPRRPGVATLRGPSTAGRAVLRIVVAR